MSVLLLRCAAPMQSWGTASRFGIRDTGREPSKSGIIGLLCAALGKPRAETNETSHLPTLSTLAGMRMGVRVISEGVLKVDYHTAGGAHKQGDDYGVVKADGKGRTTVQSWRHYLSDADFLVGLESNDEGLLTTLDEALRRPHWQLCFGRKAFAPALPVRVGVRAGELESVLRDYQPEFVFKLPPQNRDAWERYVIEIDDENTQSGAEVRMDVPVSFADREFLPRRVRTVFHPVLEMQQSEAEV